jgi:hypothetical protein
LRSGTQVIWRAVILAYVDESGDIGRSGGSKTYTLACVMVGQDAWLDTFDRLISYRRHLRDRHGYPIRTEIKANYLLQNNGPFLTNNPRSAEARYSIYRQTMRLVPKLGLDVFAVVIDKEKAEARYPDRPFDDIAWEWLLQRLERRATAEKDHVLLTHDEGDATGVRAIARRMRRAGTAGSKTKGLIPVPFTRLIDDPVPRDSRQSYFLQLADLAAYAAFRRLYPPKRRYKVPICPESMWDELGAARFQVVTRGASPLAIVHRIG